MTQTTGFVFYRGSETAKRDIAGRKAKKYLWYFEPAGYSASCLWSEGFETLEAAQAASQKPEEDPFARF